MQSYKNFGVTETVRSKDKPDMHQTKLSFYLQTGKFSSFKRKRNKITYPKISSSSIFTVRHRSPLNPLNNSLASRKKQPPFD